MIGRRNPAAARGRMLWFSYLMTSPRKIRIGVRLQPQHAEYAQIRDAVRRAEDLGVDVATGRFGADMAVALVNDGPVTIVLDL